MSTANEIVRLASGLVHRFKAVAPAPWPGAYDPHVVALITDVHKVPGFSGVCALDPSGYRKNILKYTDSSGTAWLVDFTADQEVRNPAVTSFITNVSGLKVIAGKQAEWNAKLVPAGLYKEATKKDKTSCGQAMKAASMGIASGIFGDAILPGYVPDANMTNVPPAETPAQKAEREKAEVTAAAAGNPCKKACNPGYNCSGGVCRIVFSGGPLGGGAAGDGAAVPGDGELIGNTNMRMPTFNPDAFGGIPPPKAPAPAGAGGCPAAKPLDPISQCYKECTDGAKTHLCGCKTKIEQFEELMEAQGCDLRCSAKSRAKTCAKRAKSGCSVCK